MAKPFVSLLRREFSGRVWQMWGFFLAAALIQPLVFWFQIKDQYQPKRFEEVYMDSAAPVLLAVFFAGIVGWMVWMCLRDCGNGSICTLMTLPGGRGQLFWSKLLGYAGAVFLLLAGVLAGVLLCYPVYLSWQAELAQRTHADLTLNAGLWLALNQTPLFRLLCPMTFREMAASLLLLITLPVWACTTGWRIAGRRWVRGGVLSLSAAVCWALVFRGRLTDFGGLLDISSLIVLAVLVILMAADCLWLLHRGEI
ncbi:MAG TPA: hypothetical protein IAC82_04525 [Candidatus Merdivicinus intestinigallinarum]|nr:hypothetical protein [Candidatus Merdivicinus intestinigallinarum]